MTRASAGESPLRSRDYRLLVSGLAVSTAGDWLYNIALVVVVYERTDSAAWVGAASILRLLPYVLLGPLAGTVSDRYDKRKVMIVCDLLRAALMLAIAICVALEAPILVILLLVCAATSVGTPYGPAVSSLVPVIVDEKRLARANALMGTVENVSIVLGPSIGALLLVIGSPTIAFVINAATFLGSATTAAAISARTGEGTVGDSQRLLGRLTEGIRAATASSVIVVLLMFVFIAGLLYGFELVVIVLLAEGKFGLGTAGIGWFNAAVGIGGIAAAGLASRLAENPRSDLMLLASVVATATPFAIMALTASPAIGLVAMAINGAGTIALDVIVMTLLQRSVPSGVQARVFGIIDSVAVSAMLLGSLIAPIMVSSLGLNETLLVIGALLPVATLLSAPRLIAITKRAQETVDKLRPVVELLERSTLFEGATRQTLEAVAATATVEKVAPGSAVVEEGDEADDIFIVVEGTLDVVSRGESGDARKVNELGPGDHFGEIGVLEQIPRTATVTATTETTLYRIPGTVLTDIVNQEPTVSGTIIDAMIGRLARTHPSLEVRSKEKLDDAVPDEDHPSGDGG